MIGPREQRKVDLYELVPDNLGYMRPCLKNQSIGLRD